MSGGHSSSEIGDAIKKGVGMVHGTGEAIRGNFNAAVDQAGGDRVGVDKNAAIATKGADEIEHGYHRTGHGAGVTPVDVDRERLNTTQTTSTNYGSHSTNTANKLDPRFDSDMDHRGTATGSANVGHHSNNVANKLDPRIDSDADHRAYPSGSCVQTFYSQTDGTDDSTSEPSRPIESRGVPRSSSDDNVHHGTSSKDSTAPSDEPLSETKWVLVRELKKRDIWPEVVIVLGYKPHLVEASADWSGLCLARSDHGLVPVIEYSVKEELRILDIVEGKALRAKESDIERIVGVFQAMTSLK